MSHKRRATSKAFLASRLIAHCSLLYVLAWAEPATTETAASHYNSGLAYERLGRLEEAYTELQLACALDANEARMALALGVIATRLGRYEVAQRALEHSIALDANSIAAYYQLAYLYERQLITDRAIDSWSRFLELNQDELLKLEAKKHIQFLESQRS
jgi:tetratricopeptide (TPR) repeat protein